MSEGADFKNSAGFGLMFVGMLTKQLRGSIHLERRNGMWTILEFEKQAAGRERAEPQGETGASVFSSARSSFSSRAA